MTFKAIGYVRVSSIGQVDGEGLGVQRDQIEAWCRYQGIDLDIVETDAGISGATIETRPGFKRAMRAALDHGERGILVTGRLDRLGRDALDMQEVVALLLDHGVRIVSLKDGIDSASGLGGTVLKLLTNILAGFAELERDTIRQRLLDGRRRAEREGRAYASEPRYGRRLQEDGNTVVDDLGELAAVERARALRQEGMSFRAIAQRLGDEGHRPRRATVWSAVVIRRLVLGARGVPVAAGKRLGRARTDTILRRLLDTSVDDRASSTAP